jgi:hypothetical protein
VRFSNRYWVYVNLFGWPRAVYLRAGGKQYILGLWKDRPFSERHAHLCECISCRKLGPFRFTIRDVRDCA